MRIDPGAVGVEVSWSFGDGSLTCVRIDRAVLSAVISDAGYDAASLLPVVDLAAALKRVHRFAPGTDRIKVSRLAQPNTDTPQAYGIYYRVDGDESGDDWLCGARVRAECDGVVCRAPEHGEYEPMAREVGETIAASVNDLLSHAINLDLSQLLTAIGRQAGWIARRRNAGGVYFLRRGETAQRFVDLLLSIRDLTAGDPTENRFLPELVELYPEPMTMDTLSISTTTHFNAQIAELVDNLEKFAANERMLIATLMRRCVGIDLLIEQAADYRLFLQDDSARILPRLRSVRGHFQTAIEAGHAGIRSELDALTSLVA